VTWIKYHPTWIRYHPRSPNRPKSRKPVLLRFAVGAATGMASAVVVGYLKHSAGTIDRYWVTPGYDRGVNPEPTHWQDCLGDNFYEKLRRIEKK